jgi:hypothetical protein
MVCRVTTLMTHQVRDCRVSRESLPEDIVVGCAHVHYELCPLAQTSLHIFGIDPCMPNEVLQLDNLHRTLHER